MEDDDDEEMADYGTDLSDDVESIVDPHFDAKARHCHGRLPSQAQLLLVTLRSRLRQMTAAAACSLSRTLNRSRMLPVRA